MSFVGNGIIARYEDTPDTTSFGMPFVIRKQWVRLDDGQEQWFGDRQHITSSNRERNPLPVGARVEVWYASGQTFGRVIEEKGSQ